MLSSKIKLFVFLFLSIQSCFLFADSPPLQRVKIDLTGYEQISIPKKEYRYSNNWDKFIVGNTEFKMAYKLIKNSNMNYLSDIVYFLEKGGEITILGSLSIANGFRNAFGEQFIIDKNLLIDSTYMKNELVGFSVDCLKYPFYIKGISRDTKTGKFFTTEALTRIEVVTPALSIIEHKSDY
jgi:hypothetical protein